MLSRMIAVRNSSQRVVILVPVLVQRGNNRSFGNIGRVVRTVLKIRYVVIGSIVGGGVTISQTWDRWKSQLPDVDWLKDYIPDSDRLQQWEDSWTRGRDRVKEARERWGTNWRNLSDTDGWLATKRKSVNDWLDSAAKSDVGLSFGRGLNFYTDGIYDWDSVANPTISTIPDFANEVAVNLIEMAHAGTSNGSGAAEDFSEKLNKIQDETMSIQLKYQRELEKLEKENKELRKQIMLKGLQASGKRRKSKKSLIDMYSEVLDNLVDYDSSYSTQDHLPRVVVVGDQSSGKTSVLEMVAKARIFPRGSGEMMTRSPVKVTLSEGPYHVAQFKDSQREFDLAKESELADLRKEIELRMKNSVQDGKTVSSEVIALTVKGPGLPRMVLVDLPGVISTVTAEMAKETKDDIVRICRSYMENPNAIILCIQDGSVDAERSNVTDLVTSMDPQGKRTILVLTKVDLAEDNLANPDRIKKILEGRLFPMKAIGYFAVVTGKGNANDSIESIRKYEEDFFGRSKLFHDGVLKPSQMTTRNMSLAVSETFWKMVKESVEQQADAFKATRFNLETEWKNNFPRVRELDRDELYEKARGEILDEIVNLSQISAQKWEELLQDRLWDIIANYFFENIYIPASMADNVGTFNTTIDIKLKHWADTQLPKKCVDVAWHTLKDEFDKLVTTHSDGRPKADPIFDQLKGAVLDQAVNHHKWDQKASEYLRVIQLNALEDRTVPDKYTWDETLRFMEKAVRHRLDQTNAQIRELKGPGFTEKWLYWRYSTEIQQQREAADSELSKLLSNQPDHGPALNSDELIVIRKNLESRGLSCDVDLLREMWHESYRAHFLQRALRASHECRNFFYHHQKGFGDTEVDCNAVVLFWRVKKMLTITGNSLRQQIVNSEARRLEKEIKEVLEEWSQDPQVKKQHLTGRRVNLAEELKQVRLIQETLEEFIQALNQEKR